LGVSLLLVGNQMHFDNFLPMFELPLAKYIQGTHIILTIPFGEIVIFMMVAPHTDTKNKSHLRYVLNGFLLGGFMLLLVVVRDTAVLGNALHLFTLPAFETLRLATLVERLSRMEIMFAIVLIVLLFFKITVLHYVTTISAAQVFGMKSYRPLALTIGALMIAYTYTLYPSSIEHAYTSQETAPFGWTFFEALLPLVTLVVAKIRKLGPGKKGAQG
jgi:spore germination protein KB